MKIFKTKLLSLPLNLFYVKYNDKRYLVTKQIFSKGNIIKIYGEELGGNDIVSGNYFKTIKNGLLKPCEMSDKKVIDFILNLELLES